MKRRNHFFAAIAIVIALVGMSQPACAEEKGTVEKIGNAVCPVSGKPVAGTPDAPTFYSDYQNYRIGFMCPVCKAKFDSGAHAQKLDWLNKALKSAGKPPLK
jgi:hypothetical protein